MAIEHESISKDKTPSMVGNFPTTTSSVEVSQSYQTGHLKKGLKNRHMQMIAIGGTIGAGLFVGSGSALHSGGPASLVMSYLVVGVMLLMTTLALAEMAVLFPVNGAFFTYVTRFVDPSLGFAVGWEYALGWLTLLPFELTAASITIEFWNDKINAGVWMTSFLVSLVIVQIFGVRGYGEVEFVLGSIKVLTCLGFILLGIIIDCGGVGNQSYIGARYWCDPGPFNNSVNGFFSVFVIAAFAFGGTEMVGLAAAETQNPLRTIPRASKQVFWRILILFVLNLFILSLLISSDDDRLLGSSGANTKASPFVLVIQDADIPVLPSIFDAVITVSTLSVANSCTYGSTRIIQAMAAHGMAFKRLAVVDDAGRPRWCILLQLSFGLLVYIGLAADSSAIFAWLLSLSGLAFVFVWACICLAHIRMRAAWQAQGLPLDSIPYRAPFGVYGSYIGLLLNISVLIAIFFVAIKPSPDARPSAAYFFQQYLAFSIFVLLFVGYKVHSRDKSFYVKALDMDLHTDAVLRDQLNHQVTAERSIPLMKRIWRSIF